MLTPGPPNLCSLSHEHIDGQACEHGAQSHIRDNNLENGLDIAVVDPPLRKFTEKDQQGEELVNSTQGASRSFSRSKANTKTQVLEARPGLFLKVPRQDWEGIRLILQRNDAALRKFLPTAGWKQEGSCAEPEHSMLFALYGRKQARSRRTTQGTGRFIPVQIGEKTNFRLIRVGL